MTDQEVRAIIDETIERAYACITNTVAGQIHGNAAEAIPQAVGVETALIQAAAIFASIISREYGWDIEMFAQLARVEFEIAAVRVADAKARRH
jgi:hypothetical protein